MSFFAAQKSEYLDPTNLMISHEISFFLAKSVNNWKIYILLM